MSSIDGGKMYSSAEAAEALGVTRQTVTRYVQNGLIEAKYVGLKKAIRIPEEKLVEFAKKQGVLLQLEKSN